ncbi:hypothetical protein NX02_26615 [Sphingomonas sanxanigenens DSM 19645 = NX02]|uniref:Uncharacterized protein n=2 Tax=Sphingomonas sanxanigenens TaxID=397260 RepID=W0AG74_9SPHN|nr:hypothetical protein NX02_26615 [Sphingomonas sanxanigenens DSM 19645 = NX02]
MMNRAVIAALLVTGTAPAMAAVPAAQPGWHQADQDYWGRDRRRWHRRHRDRGGIDTGDVLAGAAVIGVLAAVLSSADKKRKREEAERNAPPPSQDGGRWDDRPYDQSADNAPRDNPDDGDYGAAPPGGWNDGADRDGDRDNGPAGAPAPGGQYAEGAIISSESAAVDACSVAAEREAERFGGSPSIGGVDRVDGSGREWQVGGTIDVRRDTRIRPQSHRFTCSVRYGQVDDVEIDEQILAAR